MNQLALGASFAFVAGVLIYAARGFRANLALLVLTPVFMTLGMLWAVAPDIPRLVGMHDLYMKLSFDPRCDIFFWHYSIDKIESDSLWYGALFAAMFACLLCAAWREVAIAERSR